MVRERDGKGGGVGRLGGGGIGRGERRGMWEGVGRGRVQMHCGSCKRRIETKRSQGEQTSQRSERADGIVGRTPIMSDTKIVVRDESSSQLRSGAGEISSLPPGIVRPV